MLDSFAACVEQNEFLSVPFLSTVVVTHTSIRTRNNQKIERENQTQNEREREEKKEKRKWSMYAIFGLRFCSFRKFFPRPLFFNLFHMEQGID